MSIIGKPLPPVGHNSEEMCSFDDTSVLFVWTDYGNKTVGVSVYLVVIHDLRRYYIDRHGELTTSFPRAQTHLSVTISRNDKGEGLLFNLDCPEKGYKLTSKDLKVHAKILGWIEAEANREPYGKAV